MAGRATEVGGSVITPLMSISRAFGDAHQFPDIVFLHAGRTPQDFIFNDELAFRARTVRNFRVIFLPESISGKPDFMGVVGKISKGFLAAAVPTFKVTFAKQAKTIDVAASQSVLAAAKKFGVRLPDRRMQTASAEPVNRSWSAERSTCNTVVEYANVKSTLASSYPAAQSRSAIWSWIAEYIDEPRRA